MGGWGGGRGKVGGQIHLVVDDLVPKMTFSGLSSTAALGAVAFFSFFLFLFFFPYFFFLINCVMGFYFILFFTMEG